MRKEIWTKESKETLDENKTSVWHWSDLWDKEEVEDNSSDENGSFLWSSIKFWDSNESNSTPVSIQKPRPTNQEILMGKEEW